MNNNQEELEKILSQVLMKHHDDISSQDDDAIAEARDAIIELVKRIVPEEFTLNDFSLGKEYWKAYREGFNSCRTEMLRRIE